jgi:Uma2 family endonuclease
MTQASLNANIAVNVPPTVSLTLTHEQFIELARANGDLRLERAATGHLIIMPPTGSETGNKNADLSGQLWLWNRQTQQGVVFDSSTGFHLPNGSDRSPDAAWIRQDRWDAIASAEQQGFAPICPDFVLELRSPADNLAPLQAKMREYQDNGARLGWLIDRSHQTVEIYRRDREVEVLERPATLAGEDILPGFVLDLAVVWD